MARFNLLSILALCCVLGLSFASIPSFGLQTAAATRSKFHDRDFLIQFNRGTQVNTPAFQASIADVTNFPVLGGRDVQLTILRVTVKSVETLFAHSHPRASETLLVVQGTVRSSFRFEGIGQVRTVTNVIGAGESTVFPQGLIHETVCISQGDCTFMAVLNSADPGTVPADI